MSYDLEICAASLASAVAAEAGGATRIELCQSLEVGGLTPSYGLLQAVLAAVRLPVHVLIRPRPGGFVYDADELAVMQADVAACRALGCAGVVLGALTATGRVDGPACRALLAAAGPLAVTFHRAIDVCANPAAALEDIVELGCRWVLTSGGAATAAAGATPLAALVRQAAGRVGIMAGAGIEPANVAALAVATRAPAYHASARRPLPPEAGAGLFAAPRAETDATLVAELAARLAAAG